MNRSLYFLLLIAVVACNTVDKTAEQKSGINKSKDLPVSGMSAPSSVFDTTVVTGFNGDTTAQINKTLKLIADFDKASAHFPSDTFNVHDKTTEGCEIIVIRNNTTGYLKFYGTLYGEMGKKSFSYYVLNSRHPRLSFVSYTDIVYDKPIYMDDMKVKGDKTSYEIYCDNKLIAVLNEQKIKQTYSVAELVKKERSTQSFFNDYIGQTKIVK